MEAAFAFLLLRVRCCCLRYIRNEPMSSAMSTKRIHEYSATRRSARSKSNSSSLTNVVVIGTIVVVISGANVACKDVNTEIEKSKFSIIKRLRRILKICEYVYIHIFLVFLIWEVFHKPNSSSC